MQPEVRDECLRRISYIEGHLRGVRRMMEEDKYCADVLKQTFAVRKALQKLEYIMLDGHLRDCVVSGIREGREDQVIGELLELYTFAEGTSQGAPASSPP